MLSEVYGYTTSHIEYNIVGAVAHLVLITMTKCASCQAKINNNDMDVLANPIYVSNVVFLRIKCSYRLFTANNISQVLYIIYCTVLGVVCLHVN